MDWHLLEVSIVTVLAIWVYLFSAHPLSRGVAVVMMLINVFWVLVDRERRDAERRQRRRQAPAAPERGQPGAPASSDDEPPPAPQARPEEPTPPNPHRVV